MANVDYPRPDLEYDWVDLVPDALICLICKCAAAVNPHQTQCCGRVFCKDCLDRLPVNVCPQCRVNLQTYPDKRSEREVLSLNIHCGNRSNGCNWTGELRESKKHLDVCQFEFLPCPNGCINVHQNSLVMRRDMEMHTRESCPRRWYMCCFCLRTGEYCEITTTHLNSCPELILCCPNRGCGEFMPRR